MSKEIDKYRDATYNEKIKPLADQLLAICLENDVPCIMAFEHQEHWYTAERYVPEYASLEFKQANHALEGKVSVMR